MGEIAYAVADVLAAREIPFAFIAGYDAAVPARHANVSRIEKPLTHLMSHVACSKRFSPRVQYTW
jgi:hypothetical protein